MNDTHRYRAAAHTQGDRHFERRPEKLAAIMASISEQVLQWAENMDPADLRGLGEALGTLNRILSRLRKDT